MSTLFADQSRGAELSEDGRYRYDLWRRWANGPLMGWIMLNPSTADAELDDATIRRCMGFARREGFAGITVRNLYAYRTPKPKVLVDAARAGVDVIGPDNDTWLRQLAADRFGVKVVVAGWGAAKTPGARHRVSFVTELLGARLVRLHAPHLATDAPHPLYIHGDTPLVEYEP